MITLGTRTERSQELHCIHQTRSTTVGGGLGVSPRKFLKLGCKILHSGHFWAKMWSGRTGCYAPVHACTCTRTVTNTHSTEVGKKVGGVRVQEPTIRAVNAALCRAVSPDAFCKLILAPFCKVKRRIRRPHMHIHAKNSIRSSSIKN